MGHWAPGNPRDAELLAFLRRHGPETTPLANELGLGHKAKLPFRSFFKVYRNSERVSAVLLITPQGLTLPFIDPSVPAPLLPFSAGGQRSVTVLGEKRSVRWWLNETSRTPLHCVHYLLMEQDGAVYPDVSSPLEDLTFEHAHVRDLDSILPLECDYQRQEVLLDPSSLNPGVVRHFLLEKIRKQILLVAKKSGIIVAKAGTNAIGLTHNQLGGIFTLDSFRKRGISTWLISRLIRVYAPKKTSLYVKQENLPAVKVYQHLGFRKRGAYTIAYFF